MAHWDDDDWYSPDRLRYQAGPLLAGEADGTTLDGCYILDLPSGTAVKGGPVAPRYAGLPWGPIVLRRELFEQGLRYPSRDLGEESSIFLALRSAGRRLICLDNPAVFFCVRHEGNIRQARCRSPRRFSSWAGNGSRSRCRQPLSPDCVESYVQASLGSRTLTPAR